MPISLDLLNLYHNLLDEIMPLKRRGEESTSDLFERAELLKVKTKERKKLELRLKKEEQFNRKVEINKKFKQVKKEIKFIKRKDYAEKKDH